jgi:hypothetical protein
MICHQSNGHERRDERGHRDDVIHELRRLIHEVPRQHRRRRRTAEQLVGEIHKSRNIEDAEQREEAEEECPQVLAGHVEIQQAGAGEVEMGRSDHQDDAVLGRAVWPAR